MVGLVAVLRSYFNASVFVFLFAGLCAQAVPLRVVMVDGTGAGFTDVLVIVRSLEDGKESFRALTDSSGIVPVHDLNPGLYRLIATCPYGICQTTVHEFLVKRDPIDLRLPLEVVPTRGNTVT